MPRRRPLTLKALNLPRALTLLQFVMVCLGVFALHILGKAGDVPGEPALLAGWTAFLARYGWWFLFVPLFDIIMAGALLERVGRPPVVVFSGILTFGIALLFGLALVFHLR